MAVFLISCDIINHIYQRYNTKKDNLKYTCCRFYTPTLIFRSLHLFICAVYNNNVLWLTFLNTLWQDYISFSTSSSFTTSTNNDSVNSTNFSMQWRQQFITNTSYYYCKCPNFEVTYVKLMFRCLLNTFRTISRSVS